MVAKDPASAYTPGRTLSWLIACEPSCGREESIGLPQFTPRAPHCHGPILTEMWCGHGQQFIPLPEADSYWTLVPVVEPRVRKPDRSRPTTYSSSDIASMVV